MKELSREEKERKLRVKFGVASKDKVEELRIQFGEKARKGELSSLVDDMLNPVDLSQGG